MFTSQLASYELLKHPFYQAWQEGKLTLATLRCYAKQYMHHVNAFPCYISRIHSQSQDLKIRRILLENLMDEEGVNGTAHPILWENFAKGLGIPDEELAVSPLPHTQNLLDTFNQLTTKNLASGLGALYAYERQIPNVAKTKIKGLKKFYGKDDPNTLEFFTVHQQADEWHSQEVEALIKALPPSEQKQVEEAAVEAAQALWDFLTGIEEERLSSTALTT